MTSDLTDKETEIECVSKVTLVSAERECAPPP